MKVKQIFSTAIFAALFALVSPKVHAVVVYNGNLANETGLAYDNNYSLDLGGSQLRYSNIDDLSMQAIYSSATFTTATFNDGTASTGTITISTTSLTTLAGARGTDTLTVSKNASIAGVAGSDSVNVASNTYLAANNVSVFFDGNIYTSNVTYSVGSSSTATAANLAAAINLKNNGFTATSAGSTVTVSCVNLGTYCNSKPITSSASTRLTLSTTYFTGGVDPVSFTLNGIKMVYGDLWSVGASSAITGTNIMNSINNYAPVGSIFSASTGTSTPGVVTITCIASGTACNSYALVTSSAAILARGAATFSGGVNHAFIVINGTALTEATDWSVLSTATGTAKSISDAIRANSTLSPIVNSSWTIVATSSFGVVTATSSYVGATRNYGWFTSKPSLITMLNGNMYGGTNSAISTTTSRVTVTSNGFTLGLALLYAKSAGTSPGSLVAQTTYYAIPVDANTFKLALTSTGAIAGTSVAITTQTPTGGGSFTLTPIGYTGTAAFKWQVSNDNSNWTDLSVSSVTVTPAIPPSSSVWDFGVIAYRYIRAKVTAPTKGGLYLLITGTGRSNN